MAGIGQTIDTFLRNRLWKADGADSIRQSLRARFLRLIYVLVVGLSEEQLILRAMSLVYTTLLSIVPLLAVSFSVLKAFGVHTRFLIFLYYFLEPLGESGIDISMKIIGFVENVKVSVLGSIGLSVLLYTVLSMVQKVESALNYIWNIRDTRGFSQRFSNYMSVLLIGPVLIFSALGITASLMSSSLMKKILDIHVLGFIIYFLSRLMPYVLISAAFTLIYIFLPNTKVRFRAALTGGITAAILWETIGWIFASFIAKSAHYSAIYSGFATLILFLIWLYWNFLTLLIGARVSFYTQYPRTLDTVMIRMPSERQRERAALAIMYLVGKGFHTGREHWRFEQLVQRLGLPSDLVRDVIAAFEAKELLVPAQGDPPVYLPGKDLASITLAEIVSAVRTAGEDSQPHVRQHASLPGVDEVLAKIEGSITSALETETLRDLIMRSEKGG